MREVESLETSQQADGSNVSPFVANATCILTFGSQARRDTGMPAFGKVISWQLTGLIRGHPSYVNNSCRNGQKQLRAAKSLHNLLFLLMIFFRE